jgi:hypothetical protein
MKLTTHLHIVLRSRNVELYFYSPIRLHGLAQLIKNRDVTFPFTTKGNEDTTTNLIFKNSVSASYFFITSSRLVLFRETDVALSDSPMKYTITAHRQNKVVLAIESRVHIVIAVR